MAEGIALVKQECANLVSNECIGMTIGNTLWRERGRCYIAEGEDCDYYVQYLFPLALKVKKGGK